MERDGRDSDGGRGNIRLRKLSSKTLEVVLQRSWRVVDQTADVRWMAAEAWVRAAAEARNESVTRARAPT